ncbi:MAG: 16S rRNA (cytosine(1402)-N(4))-methyltransferase [Candidatus Yonathbacteria bacterium CG10_big_fil_rev_8_21_14_0_10_43_136]|uniref:Ribosomal RNA small subunit methyltransferase H n=2 Tax=Parcubacteria group TaxID=1794811 RepID=A0A2M7Q4A6_9BACT|nr:MAG: 16S rRNA (cytosine(1402)-N(4))-methyltransferase [Candidatus Nomurabacteria bacterium CG2_30_43_9]PIR40945.1 MAG: 16S rRNA (cytosine(1402)-N(4))-methyltransferase [Candidatus Yonathbacteria bacterium CG10_big_fil_rev_8_21_14_0_10_43_136]PIX57397.1 MAG: 16S rRNA (cytosine(1402)-N(4))-methyltransferase [Candidatus Yonathbacteria bacterium CG_4_10_14_3_um_filter_43_12]PIY58261.1 MAG: 16S rRNA (cytosine(1402)-N(4))-methyltransferase [Candidatus Yonathbacteria bacterium CG_4_10_14_0_8_um_filt
MHISVLLKESTEGLALAEGKTVFEGTVGLGGHSRALCEMIGKTGFFIGTDADQESLAIAEERLKDLPCKKLFVCDNFRNIDAVLAKASVGKVDAILLDIGLSNRQLDVVPRGFSFMRDEPLLMTFRSEGEGLTAREIVNEWAEESLADIIYGYGEERFARRIAKGIIEARKEKQIETSGQLAEIVKKCVPKFGFSRINPATKTFQALRIAVNDELGALREGIAKGFEHLAPGGRMAIISFHSLEDRIVKEFFRQKANEGVATLVTKKPIVPSDIEVKENPKSRSSKLRIVIKN